MLTGEQEKICSKLIEWYSEVKDKLFVERSNFITVGGYAGTGKTYLISHLRKILRDIYGPSFQVAFCTFTGKASSVLKKRLVDSNSKYKGDYVGTIHGLIYIPVFETIGGKKVIVGWALRVDLTKHFDLIIIDEASMVNSDIFNDLSNFNIPIIAVGDHGQLPPVSSEKDGFNLMQNPSFILTEIHRQSLNNPILKLASQVRTTGTMGSNEWVLSKEVFKLDWRNPDCRDMFENIRWDKDTIVLCGLNRTRVKVNDLIRQKKGFTLTEPYPGERVVCLKNNHSTKLMNGQLGTLVWMIPSTARISKMSIEMDDTESVYTNLVHDYCFGKETYNGMWETIFSGKKNIILLKKLYKKTKFSSVDVFDFGYCISTHRSQGSEWRKVVLVLERSYYWDDEFYKKWLYTAVTRAKEKLFVISNFS